MDRIKCSACDGEGEVATGNSPDPQTWTDETCEKCNGNGWVSRVACPRCGELVEHGCESCCDEGWTWASSDPTNRRRVVCRECDAGLDIRDTLKARKRIAARELDGPGFESPFFDSFGAA